MRKLLITGLVALAGLPGLANADQVFDQWTVVKADGRCTAFTKPAAPQAGREGAYLAIINVPKEGVRNSVSIVYGKPGAGKGSASAKVSGTDFELLTFDTAAFAASGDPEAQLVSSMKKGGDFTVNWTDADGTASKDAYSLKGFSQARSQIDADCR